jgi:hypothetical protein
LLRHEKDNIGAGAAVSWFGMAHAGSDRSRWLTTNERQRSFDPAAWGDDPLSCRIRRPRP